MTRIVTAAVALFVLVVIVLWVRHQRAEQTRKLRLAELVATARVKDGTRIDAIRRAQAHEDAPATRHPCGYRARAKIVRLSSMDEPGGSLREIVAAVAEQREPAPWSHELDVNDGRAFLYDYGAERVVCVGVDADDPHGTLIAY